MSALQERLRANPLPLPSVMELCREAADRIDALEAENAALRSCFVETHKDPLVKLYFSERDVSAQQARIAELEAKLSEWERLRDPSILHVTLIRGLPAKLSQDQLLHIAGPNDIAARIAELEAENAALRELLNVYNLGGWMDAKRLMDERNEAQAALSKATTALKVAGEALEDMNNGWKYIRHTHGDLYGVGWDRAEGKADAALLAIKEAQR